MLHFKRFFPYKAEIKPASSANLHFRFTYLILITQNYFTEYLTMVQSSNKGLIEKVTLHVVASKLSNKATFSKVKCYVALH